MTALSDDISKEIGYKYMCVSQADFASSMVGEAPYKLRAVLESRSRVQRVVCYLVLLYNFVQLF